MISYAVFCLKKKKKKKYKKKKLKKKKKKKKGKKKKKKKWEYGEPRIKETAERARGTEKQDIKE